MAKTIAVVSGSRAEYGLLQPVLRALRQDPSFQLQLLVTGMHLAPEFGYTVRDIEADGWHIDARIETQLASDSGVGTAKSVGLGVMGFAEVLQRLQPDLLMILGDRFEIFAAAQAALFLNIPVAHIAGGDTTEGAQDEAVRHSITKLSHLHFTTNDSARARVVQLGEDPARVFAVGSPGVDQLLSLQLLDRKALATQLNLVFGRRNLLITLHPATLAEQSAQSQCRQLLAALDQLEPDTTLIFTRANADQQGRAINALIEHYVTARPQAYLFDSLGQLRYSSLMALADAVVGNSSSGLYEAPSLYTPTVDIGERQRGRLRAESVVHCEAKATAIVAAIQAAYELDCGGVINPYGDGRAAPRILEALQRSAQARGGWRGLLQKRFFSTESPRHAQPHACADHR